MNNIKLSARVGDIIINLHLSGDEEFAVNTLTTLLQQLGGELPADYFSGLAETIKTGKQQ